MELKVYAPGPATDIALANWWAHMGECGDLELVFPVDFALLSHFMSAFQAPCVLLYAEDEQGICFALWADRMMSGAFFGLWMRADRRPSNGGSLDDAVKLVYGALDKLFEVFPVLFHVTRDPHIVELGMRLGAKMLGLVPHVFDGEAAYVSVLTREDYTAYKVPKDTA